PEMMALVGPVRQVLTAPASALKAEPTPQAIVTALTGGSWPAALSTAKPWPFWTTRTVIASGTTSSTIAATDQAGCWTAGLVSSSWIEVDASNRPAKITASAPTTSAPMIGGQRRPSCGSELSDSQTTTIGPAMATSVNTA